MTMMELATMQQYHVPVKIVVLRNNVLGLVRQYQHFTYQDRFSVIDLGDSIPAGREPLPDTDYDDAPALDENDSLELDEDITLELKVFVRLKNRETGEIKESEVFMGDFWQRPCPWRWT